MPSLAEAEPLSALFLPPHRWPGALLDEAWRGVILNSAHDSVCACSIDDVCTAVLHRYSESADIAEGLADRAVAHLAARVDHDGPVVVNPTGAPRGGVVELSVPGTEAPAGTQLLWTQRAEAVLHRGPAAIVLPAAEEVDWVPGLTAFSLETADGTVLVASQREGTGQMVTGDVRAALAEVDEAGELVLRVRQQPRVTVLASVPEVPGLGWRAWTPGETAGAVPVTVTGLTDSAGADGGTKGDVAAPDPCSPTGSSRWPSTPRTGRSPSTASPGSAAWSTVATSATPTTGARPPRTCSSTAPPRSRWRCSTAARCGRGW